MGEILTYLDAIGSDDGSDAMIAAMHAVGTRFILAEYTSAGTREKFLVFDSGGVDLQDLVAVRVHVRDSGRRAYPHLDSLVDGLSFPATRADVHDTLGAPWDSRSDLDLYSEGGRHVMFNYDGDALATISIVHVPQP